MNSEPIDPHHLSGRHHGVLAALLRDNGFSV
jgi:hypothetical protein